jgi:hypothetical protein
MESLKNKESKNDDQNTKKIVPINTGLDYSYHYRGMLLNSLRFTS